MKDKRLMIGLGIVLIILMIFATGCNKQVFDTNYTFEEVYCNYDGDKFKLKIKKWKYYDGEQIQAKDYDGNTYLLSANKCYLRG